MYMLGKVKKWIRENKREFVIVVLILMVAAGLRLWRINEYMTFLGDEGRDVRVVGKLITQGDLVFIGPMTSVTTSSGHMYLGPAYYYLMAPALAFSALDPVGPAIMVALVSVLTCGLVWWVGRKWFAPIAGLVAAWLFAISPTIIIYSRSSWNPNVMPLFALLAIWTSSLARKNPKWWIGASVSLALALQSHYLALLLVPVVGLIWIETWWKNREEKDQPKGSLWKYTGLAVVVFGAFMVPQLLFESKHGWTNAKALEAFFTERQTSVNLKFYKRIGELWPLVESIFKSIIGGISVGKGERSLVVTITMAAVGLTTLLAIWRKKITMPYWIMLSWLGFGILGLLSYKQNIFDHYLGFVYPLIPLMVGWMAWQFVDGKQSWGNCASCMPVRKVWVGLLVVGLTMQMFATSPLKYGPNRQWQKVNKITDQIVEKSGGKPFNLALVANGNYDEGYRYALEKKKSQLVEIDPLIKESITEQLFVICEQECNPIGHPNTEIARFGWAQVAESWQEESSNYKIYKLVRFTPEE